MRQLLRSAGNKPPRPASEDATAPSDSSHRFDPSYPFDPIGEDQQEGAEPDSDTSPLPGAGYGGIATSGRLDKRKKAIEQSQARRREQLQDRIARESAESGNPFDGDGFGGLALPATDGPGLPGVDGLKLPGAGDLTTPSVLPKLPDNSQFNRGGFKLPTAEPFKLSPGGISSHVPGGIGGGLPLPERTGAEIQPPADGPLVGRPPDRRTTPDGSPGAEETSPSVIPGGQLNRYANPPAQSPLNPYAPPEVNISGLDLNPYRLLPRGEQNLNPYLPAPEGTTTFNPYRRRDRPATNINPYQPRRQPNLSMNPYLPITGPLAGQTGASPGAAPGLPRTGRGGSPTP